jgi:molybdopterin converting factor small subunit
MKEGDTPNPSPSFEERGSEFAIVRIHGSLGKLPNGRKLEVERVQVPLRVRDILAGLSKSFGIEIRRDSTLVLVNGVEANALLDLDTIVVRGDEVSLIPMFHGGSER